MWVTKKRIILLLFTFVFFVSAYSATSSYLKHSRPTTYPAISDVQIQKQADSAVGQIQKLQNSLVDATKTKNSIDHQYASLLAQKKALLNKEGVK